MSEAEPIPPRLPERAVRPERIPAYSLPDASCLERNRVAWRVDPGRAALLLHDLQNYWLAPFEEPGPLLANLLWLRRLCRAAGIPVLYTALKSTQSDEERGLALDLFGPGLGRTADARPGDADIVPALTPGEGEPVLRKTRYSAFFATDLEDRLHSGSRDQLLIAGVFAHHGCLVTAVDAYMRDIRVFFVADALGAHSAADHELALTYVAALCGQLTVVEQVARDLART